MELVDTYGFGHILYEMTYGQPLLMSSSKQDFSDCADREIRGILEITLASDVLNKSGPPTISQLLEIPYIRIFYSIKEEIFYKKLYNYQIDSSKTPM